MFPLPPAVLHALGIAADVAAVLAYPVIIFPALAIAVAYSMSKAPPQGGLKGLWSRLAYRKAVVVLLVIGGIAYAIDLTDRFALREQAYDSTAKLTTVYGREYKNQTVHVDGHNYIECTFENVTLVYDGVAPFGFTNSHFVDGSAIRFGSTNPAVNHAIIVVDQLFRLGPTLPLRLVPRDELR